jgi:hypothetical protein
VAATTHFGLTLLGATEMRRILAGNLASGGVTWALKFDLRTAVPARSGVAELLAVVRAAQQHFSANLPAEWDGVYTGFSSLLQGYFAARASRDNGWIAVTRRAGP